MPVFPSSTLTGGLPENVWESEVQQYAIEIDNAWPPSPDSAGNIVDFGKDYIAYMDAHPNANPQIVYLTFITRVSALTLVPSTVGKAIAAGAGATSQIANVTAQSTSSLYPAWLQGFLGANGVLRIAEGALGIVLVAVAADKLLSGNAGVATKIAKVVK